MMIQVTEMERELILGETLHHPFPLWPPFAVVSPSPVTAAFEMLQIYCPFSVLTETLILTI